MRKLVLRKEEEARDSSSLGCHHVRLGPRVRRVASGTTRFADVAQLARLGLLIPIVRRDSWNLKNYYYSCAFRLCSSLFFCYLRYIDYTNFIFNYSIIYTSSIIIRVCWSLDYVLFFPFLLLSLYWLYEFYI